MCALIFGLVDPCRERLKVAYVWWVLLLYLAGEQEGEGGGQQGQEIGLGDIGEVELQALPPRGQWLGQGWHTQGEDTGDPVLPFEGRGVLFYYL